MQEIITTLVPGKLLYMEVFCRSGKRYFHIPNQIPSPHITISTLIDGEHVTVTDDRGNTFAEFKSLTPEIENPNYSSGSSGESRVDCFYVED